MLNSFVYEQYRKGSLLSIQQIIFKYPETAPVLFKGVEIQLRCRFAEIKE